MMTRKLSGVIIFLIVLSYAAYCLMGGKKVSIVDVHYYNGNTVQVIVNTLPFFDSDKIIWWKTHKAEISKAYNIPSGKNAPFLITVYAFGNGYQEEGKQDRRCFPEMKTAKNCIDKNILMTISRTRDGSVKYQF